MNKEMKDIIKVIRSLENRAILLKGSTRKIASQVGTFLNFHFQFFHLKTLMTPGLKKF